MILILLLLVVTLFILFDYTNKKRRYMLTENIPGPNIYPVIGNSIVLKHRTSKQDMQFLEDISKNYGSIVRLWLFNNLVLICTNPKDIEVILGTPKYKTKSYHYEFLKVWLGSGLITSDGQKWVSRRKVITPTFHFKILENFVEVFDQQSLILVKKIRPHIGKGEFDLHPYISLAALDVISETAMGTKINAQNNENHEYVRAVSDMTAIVGDRYANAVYQNDLLFSIFAPAQKKRQTECLKILHPFTEKIIEERRAALKKNIFAQQNNDDLEYIGTKERMAFLDVLLQSTINGKPLSNEDIREEVDTFMFAGHDTTTAGMGFTLYCLSRHPEVQTKLFKEIRDVVGDDKFKPVTYRNLQDLKYMECVIKETLRVYPAIPIIGRNLREETEINGKLIPAGTDILLPFFLMMKNPELFPEPEKFIPERHLEENTTTKMNSYAFIPFSAGPRNCIGQKYAMLEMKCFIANILRHYEILPFGSAPDIVFNIVSKSCNGINAGIKERVY